MTHGMGLHLVGNKCRMILSAPRRRISLLFIIAGSPVFKRQMRMPIQKRTIQKNVYIVCETFSQQYVRIVEQQLLYSYMAAYQFMELAILIESAVNLC